jgi:hypothetical protein
VFRPVVCLTAAAIAFAALCSSAAADLVTVGSPLEGAFNGTECSGPTGTWANDTLGEPGAHAGSPVDGIVVRWSMAGSYTAGKPFELRVLRPAAGGAYTGVGTSARETPMTGFFSQHTWQTEIPIKAGDLIGINVNEDCVGVRGVSGSHYMNWFPALAEGATLVNPYPGNDVEIGVQAEVQPVPTASSISPATSALPGGGVVTIQGTDFEEASRVSFGATPVSDFSVESSTRITAVVPPAAKPGAAPVSVTTIAGTATVPQQLEYQGCVVPKLKGKSSAAAKKALTKADCALGKIIKKPASKSKKGKKKSKPKVTAQSRPAGKTLPAGTKVDLTVKG